MAANNLAVSKIQLQEAIFTEEEIIKQVELREHIFEIKIEEETLGFISLYDLKSYVSENAQSAQDYYVRNIDSHEWKMLYEHPYFQRRKPQLVSIETLKEEDGLQFFILQKGQKIGPFEKYELLSMVERKEILLNEMVSFNGGHTWSKLYQIDGFDRRTLKESDQLPGMPSSELLNKPNETLNIINETTDAITSLAYLGNLKRGKSLERERDNSYEDEMAKKASTTSIYKWMLGLSIIGIIYFLVNIKSNLNSPFSKTPESTVGERAEMLKPVTESSHENPYNHSNTNVFDQGRSGKFETRKINPVKPARVRKSFMDTKNFQNSMNDSNSGSEDNNYYYDNASPMELDPVRAQISKENFDSTANPEGDGLFNQEISQ